MVGEIPDSPTQSENPWKGMSQLTIPSGLADCTFLDPEIGQAGTPPPVDDGATHIKPRDVTPQSKPVDKGSQGGARLRHALYRFCTCEFFKLEMNSNTSYILLYR